MNERLPILTSTRCLLALGLTAALWTPSASADAPAKPTAHETLHVEGWTVRIDQRLLAEPCERLGAEATALVGDRLRAIRTVLRPDRVEALQHYVIQVDLSHGALERPQYHPSAAWLSRHGYSTDLEKCVHIPVAAGFVDPSHQRVQPWSVLHELAHAYHDTVLGYDHKPIHEAWERYKESGEGKGVLHVDGHRVEHYALTNDREFFAEMTEAYAGTNDFYPFVHGELKESFPEVHRLLREIWGELR